eukprot:8686163-Pyramimonas_sp.AAC.1
MTLVARRWLKSTTGSSTTESRGASLTSTTATSSAATITRESRSTTLLSTPGSNGIEQHVANQHFWDKRRGYVAWHSPQLPGALRCARYIVGESASLSTGA